MAHLPGRGEDGRGPGPRRNPAPSREPRLGEQVLEVALLLLGPALPLVRAPLPLELLVARQGTAGLLHPALGLVRRTLVLVVLAAASAQQAHAVAPFRSLCPHPGSSIAEGGGESEGAWPPRACLGPT